MRVFYTLIAITVAFHSPAQSTAPNFDVSNIEVDQNRDYVYVLDSILNRIEIDSLITINQIEPALNLLKEELIVNPHNTSAIHKIATVLSDYGSPKESLPYFRKAIEMVPDEAMFYYGLGLSYKKLNNYEEAISNYSKCIQLNPSDTLAYYNRASAYAGIRDFESAIDDYNIELTINGEQARVYNNRGRCFMILKEYEKALSDFNRALEIDPVRSLAFLNRGILYARMNDFDNACNDLTKADELGDDLAKQIMEEICKD